jgi:hypothetical protein
MLHTFGVPEATRSAQELPFHPKTAFSWMAPFRSEWSNAGFAGNVADRVRGARTFPWCVPMIRLHPVHTVSEG